MKTGEAKYYRQLQNGIQVSYAISDKTKQVVTLVHKPSFNAKHYGVELLKNDLGFIPDSDSEEITEAQYLRLKKIALHKIQ